MIRAKIHTLSKPKQHLASALLSVLCMAAAVAVSSLYYYFVQEISPNITLIFLFFLIFASSNTVGYGYGICCSLFIVLWYNYRFTFPYHKVNFSLEGYPITFLFMCSITIFISIPSASAACSWLPSMVTPAVRATFPSPIRSSKNTPCPEYSFEISTTFLR